MVKLLKEFSPFLVFIISVQCVCADLPLFLIDKYILRCLGHLLNINSSIVVYLISKFVRGNRVVIDFINMMNVFSKYLESISINIGSRRTLIQDYNVNKYPALEIYEL